VGAVVTGGAAAENRRREGMNTLYFGDNLEVLRESIADQSIGLVYLDPPFNSGANYNIIFQPEKKSAAKATAQIQAFEDTWTWSAEADETYRRFVIDRDLTREPPGERLIKLMTSMREYLGDSGRSHGTPQEGL
jgi:site-specific DNA-methyltransferase (adenine-specific)